MYIVKNALKNLSRNKGRNILSGILIFIMLTAICVSVTIESAAKKMSGTYKERFDVTANLSVDYMSLIGGSSNGLLDIPKLTQEDYAEFADSDYVKDCITFGSTVIYAPDITAIGEEMISDGGMQIMEPDGFSSQFYSANLSLYGYSDLMLLTDFIEGNRKFISGAVFENINECVISSELAEQNGLSVGDTIEAHTARKESSQTLNLTISGIYLDAVPTEEALRNVTQNRRNDVMVGFDTLSQLSSEKYDIEGTFILSDPNAITAFTQELREKGLPKAFYPTTNADAYQQVAAPVEGLSGIMRVFMIIVLILGGGILMSLSLITIRERKYEIGILRAKGMPKGRIAAQFLTENFILVLICLVLSLSAGVVSAQPISDKLLESELAKIEQQEEDRADQYSSIFSADSSQSRNFGQSMDDIEPITTIKVSLTAADIFTIALISLALCVFTSAIGVIYISKREPMRILMERN